jgi:hypothetical protein
MHEAVPRRACLEDRAAAVWLTLDSCLGMVDEGTGADIERAMAALDTVAALARCLAEAVPGDTGARFDLTEVEELARAIRDWTHESAAEPGD